MSTPVNVTIDLTQFLSDDELKSICYDAARQHITSEQQFTRILTNSAYGLVMEEVKNRIGKDGEKFIQDATERLLKDGKSLGFALFHDGRSYNGSVGVGLQMAEGHLRSEKCRAMIEQKVENIVSKIQFDKKKFEELVIKEAARMVAEKMTTTKYPF